MRSVFTKVLFMILISLSSACVSNKYLPDFGRKDLYTDGLSPNYNSWVYNNYILKIRLPEMGDGAIYPQVNSKVYFQLHPNDTVHVYGALKTKPRDSWSASLDPSGYILNVKSYTDDTLAIYENETFSYTFENHRPIEVIKTNSRYREDNLKYSISYDRDGMISNIRIASLNDSLIVQRSYYYFHRKLIICTIDGKRDTIEHKEYLVNRKGLPVNEIDHLYLKNTIRKAIFEYKSNTDFIRNWNEYDKAGQIKTTGHEHYLDGSLTESDEKDLSPWKHRRQEFYHFNSDKLLENHISVFQSDAQNDTIAVNYRYTIDLVGHTRKTMMQNDCSKCKDCGNCGGLTTTIIHYQR